MIPFTPISKVQNEVFSSSVFFFLLAPVSDTSSMPCSCTQEIGRYSPDKMEHATWIKATAPSARPGPNAYLPIAFNNVSDHSTQSQSEQRKTIQRHMHKFWL
jgi:hypothetical protein